MRWLQHQVSTSISRLHRCNAHTALFLVKPLSSSCLIYCTHVNTVSAKRWTNEEKSFKWRKSKNGWRKREAAPVRGLGKLPFGRGPSAVVELTWSFICSQLCDSRQKSDHRCPAWLPVVHTHRHKSTHNLELKAVAHTRLIPALISQCKLFIYCWIFCSLLPSRGPRMTSRPVSLTARITAVSISSDLKVLLQTKGLKVYCGSVCEDVRTCTTTSNTMKH